MTVCNICEAQLPWSRDKFLCSDCEVHAEPISMARYLAVMREVTLHHVRMARRAADGKPTYALDDRTRRAAFIAYAAAKEAARKRAGLT